MSRCGGDQAGRCAGAGAGGVDEFWSGDVFAEGRVGVSLYEWDCERVWKNRSGDGAERGLFGRTGYGGGSAGFTWIDGDSDGSDSGGGDEYDADCDYGVCDGRVAGVGERDAMDYGGARGSLGDLDAVFRNRE